MNWLNAEVVLVPPAVVTRTSTAPVPAGAVAVIDVALLTVWLAVIPPKVTVVAPARFVPLMVTVVPPPVGPLFGAIDVTVGAPT
ncbi:hypothetical protein D3C80_997690 [compost metagenome]